MGKPKAYLRYVRFGKDSTIKWERTLPVSDSSQDAWKEMVVKDDVSEDGYAVAYLVSEGGAPFLVDDFSVTAYSSRLVAIRGYYPYGMAYGSQGTVAQTNEATGTWGDWTSADADMAPGLPGYTGQPEVEEEWWGHPFSNFGYRYYDPRIGRWHTVDPANQFSSPYDFCGGMPMERVDPDGRFVWIIPIALAVVGAYAGGSIANNNMNPFGRNGWDWQDKRTYIGMGIGAAVGFGLGAGISAGLASAGMTTNAQFLYSLGFKGAITCPAEAGALGIKGLSSFWSSGATMAASAAINAIATAGTA